MKEKILKLREEGLSYKQISKQLGCSKGTVSYYCGEGQKEKSKKRIQARRKEIVILKKVENFQVDRKIRDKAEDFQRERQSNNKLGKRSLSFRWQDVIDKFGWETRCYLTGKEINLKDPKTYQFDHITPYSKGGSSTLDNLGILSKDVNAAKSDMTVEDFLNLCKNILEYNGYEVKRL